MNKPELWASKVLFAWKHISLRWQEVTFRGRTFEYEVVVRNSITWIVWVLPVTEDNKIVLIKQFRIPQNDFILETPAWLCDKEWESKIDATRREMQEETWYDSENIVYAYTAASSAGLTSERIDCYIALNCKKIADILALDGSECIEVVEIPLDGIDEYLASEIASWTIIDWKLPALLYFYKNLIK